MNLREYSFICPKCGGAIINGEVPEGINEVEITCSKCNSNYTIEIETKHEYNTQEFYRLSTLAKNALSENDFAKASKYRETEIQKNPDKWEYVFFDAFFEAMDFMKQGTMVSTAKLFNAADKALESIKTSVFDEGVQHKLVDYINGNIITLAKKMFDYEKESFDKMSSSALITVQEQVSEKCWSSAFLLYEYGNKVVSLFGEKFRKIAYYDWLVANNQTASILKYLSDTDKADAVNMIDEYSVKIKTIDPNYQKPDTNVANKKNGCYVATAVYGSYDCSEVWTLRRFRDYSLASSWYGRLFIAFYYFLSPTIVKWFGENKWFNSFAKGILDSFVTRLKIKGYDDSPYSDIY